MEYMFLILGFAMLIKGADYFVEAASDVAARLKVPDLIVGMTVVALGTSLPELSVSVTSSISGSNAMAVSNVVGSNIFNVLVVLGATALIKPVDIDYSTLKRDFPSLLFISTIAAIIAYTLKGFNRVSGAALVLILIVSIAISIKKAEISTMYTLPKLSPFITGLYLICGASAIKYGGDFVVASASRIAESFGMSETLVGLTIVACGTSLPELVTSIVAARKGKVDMAVGNVVGSNLINIGLVLGLSSAISPIAILPENLVDMILMCIVTIVAFIFCKTNKLIEKWEGFILIVLYAGYMTYAIIR